MLFRSKALDIRFRIVSGLIALVSVSALAADIPLLYSDAKMVWDKTKAGTKYQKYASEFSQFNNHFHLDEKDGCYALSTEQVSLMLVITHSNKDKFAIIESVLSGTDNAKTRCFQSTYKGIRTKIPPFLPFVLQMNME